MMKRYRKPLMLTIVGASFALNGAFLVDHVRRGTFRRMLVRMDLSQAATSKSAYQAEMVTHYRKLAEAPGGVVFAGDSLINQGPWSEFYSEIHNRGIPGETSAMLLGRLGDVTRGKPRTLILLTGANDFIQGVPLPQLARNYRSILEKTRADSPGTEVAVIGMLPVAPALAGGQRYDNPSVVEANRRLEALTREFPGVRFLDLTSRLADESGKLRREFTVDGLHLTLEGYFAVREAVRTVVDRPSSSTHPSAEGPDSTIPTDHAPAQR